MNTAFFAKADILKESATSKSLTISLMCSSMWVLDLQKEPPPLALSTQIAGQQAAAASLECAAQLAASAWRSGQHNVVCTTVGALLSQSL